MTKKEFEEYYAKNSEITMEQLHSFGLQAYPCDCEEPSCKGWQMLHEEPSIYKQDEN